MNRYLATLFCVILFALNVTPLAAKGVEITAEEAAKKKFTNICGKKYTSFIKFKGVTLSATWPEGDGSPANVDKLVAQAEAQCISQERTILEALFTMKVTWFKACIAKACVPATHFMTNDYLGGKAVSNCGGGEVTVTNRHNPNMFCVYSVRSGSVYPEKMQDKEQERCYVGEDDSQSPGYGGASVTMPAADADAKYLLALTCRKPSNLPVYLQDRLQDYEDSDDEEEPPKVPKEDPK